MENKTHLEFGPRYEKIESMKTFERLSLPIIPYQVLDEKHFKGEVFEFARKHKLDKIMVRTDGKGKSSPRLLDTPINEETFREIESYFLNGYLVFIAHPGNIYRNMHSANIMVSDDEICIEVVGPGFMAADLNRGNMVPQETLIISIKDFQVTERNVWEEMYHLERKKRLQESDVEELQKHRSYLLEFENYPKLNDRELIVLEDASSKLMAWKKANKKGDFIASMSFIDLGSVEDEQISPAFWDIHEETSAKQAPVNKFYRYEGD